MHENSKEARARILGVAELCVLGSVSTKVRLRRCFLLELSSEQPLYALGPTPKVSTPFEDISTPFKPNSATPPRTQAKGASILSDWTLSLYCCFVWRRDDSRNLKYARRSVHRPLRAGRAKRGPAFLKHRANLTRVRLASLPSIKN